VATLLQAPLIYIMSVKYGGVGAAIVGTVFYALYIFVGLPLMHRVCYRAT
jgi:hypothetical protein